MALHNGDVVELTEQCGYTFGTPEDCRGNMTAAKLEFYGGETYTADKADLSARRRTSPSAWRQTLSLIHISAAGGQLVQPGPLGGLCPAGPRHGARL